MIMGRRQAAMGLACLFAAGAAVALKPRHRMSLAGGVRLDDVIPAHFADWTQRPTEALIRPEDENDLAAQLYSQIVGRLYANSSGAMVMLLIAYGDTQNDLLQLHRPEICYPAFGFEIDRSVDVDIPLASGLAVPARALTASNSQRVEHILYWTRIGEHLPTSGREQRLAKLEDQLNGVIPDGVLVRMSMIGDDPAAALSVSREFAHDMLLAMPAEHRAILIGTHAADALAAKTRHEASAG